MPRDTIDHSTIRKKLLDSVSSILVNRCQVELPSIELPDLASIEVAVPPIRPLEVGDVVMAFENLRREFAEVHERAPGSELVANDEAIVDVIAYREGKLVPFSLRSALTVIVDDDPFWPELGHALLGQKVASSVEFPLVLPADPDWGRPDEAEVQVACTIREAHQVVMPEPNDPEFWAATGLGTTLDAVMDALARECLDQRIQEQKEHLRERVLLAALEKSDFEVPGPLVDAEIRDWFRRHEGDTMVGWGISADEQAEALQHWLTDPLTVLEAQRRVAGTMFLGAFVKAHQLQVTRDEMAEYVAGIADELQRSEGVYLDTADLMKHLTGKHAEMLQEHLLRIVAIEQLVESVELTGEWTEHAEWMEAD